VPGGRCIVRKGGQPGLRGERASTPLASISPRATAISPTPRPVDGDSFTSSALVAYSSSDTKAVATTADLSTVTSSSEAKDEGTLSIS